MQINVKRFQGSYVDGVFVKELVANLNLFAHIQPFEGTSMENSTDGKWQKSVIKIFSENALLVKDEFDYKNKHYVVQSVADYSLGAVAHYESIAHEVEIVS